MSIIDFEQAKLLKEEATFKLAQPAIQMKITSKEIPYWIHMLTHLTHTVGFFLKKESNKQEKKLLQKEFIIVNDLMEKMLVYTGLTSEEPILFSLSYEEMIILEGQLELFIEICEQQDDTEYLELTQKYLNTLYKVMDDQAEFIDILTKNLLRLNS